MSYFVTGATGFIGRHLVQELVDHREGDIFVLVRPGSVARIEKLTKRWGSGRVQPVVGDLAEDALGVDNEWVAEHAGKIDHFFHLAAIYDMTADDAANEQLNVGGTRHALQLAELLSVGCFHQVSSVAAAGDYVGHFDETMFDEGQSLPSPYHRTKYESEKIVRTESTVPWRVYRPAIVVGDSQTGAMDKVDGPYYFFPVLKRLRDTLPAWLPLVGADLGDTNVVPVDYVAKAMDHLAHLPDRDGEAFHLVNPEPQSTVEMINTFCAAAGAPRFATPVDRNVTSAGPLAMVPRRFRASALVNGLVKVGPVQALLDQTVGRLGIPAEVLAHTGFRPVFDSRITEKALAGSGIAVPDLESYARTLWGYWEENLDASTGRNPKNRAALKGKHVVITGASSGIGQVTALKVAQAGGIPVLVARGKDKLEETKSTIEMRGGTAHVFPCDLSDLEAIDRLCEQISTELPSVDFVINNAGRSIRRSLRLSQDRFHDFERTMQLNYFGAIRLVMGLIPRMKEQKSGHIVNVSSIGVQTNPPRFSAYVASKSALDSWSNVVASELVGDGITFTSIHMPLVRTPMIAPT
ncbi:MAG TPA: SDR family oxidoreductase, partial [Nocardioides sp.]|nr:SDR family oxidoreductase [Nocardioides sp.]